MRAAASVLAFVTLTLPAVGAAKPGALWVESVGAPAKPARQSQKSRAPAPKTEVFADYRPAAATVPAQRQISSAQRETIPAQESAEFLGFSGNEAVAVFGVKVREDIAGKSQSYEVIRVVSSETEELLATFRKGQPSPAPEWQSAKSEQAWTAFAARADLWSDKVHHARHIFRVAIDRGDKVADSLSTKKCITISTADGSGLGMTPVVRLYDGRLVWLSPIPRVDGQPGKNVTAQVTVFHSRTGMHVAVLTRYSRRGPGAALPTCSSSPTGAAEQIDDLHATDLARVFAMPGDPIGTITIGAFNMTTASEAIGERRFGELNPGFEEAFKRWGRD